MTSNERQTMAKIMDLIDGLEAIKSETNNEHLAKVLGLSASALARAVRDVKETATTPPAACEGSIRSIRWQRWPKGY